MRLRRCSGVLSSLLDMILLMPLGKGEAVTKAITVDVLGEVRDDRKSRVVSPVK